MDLENRYKTQDGMKCNILQLIKLEPEWAANIIQHYEKQLAVITSATYSDGEERCTCRHPGNMRNFNCPVHRGA